MTNFFNKFKKPCFWPVFPIFEAKIFFSIKSSSVMHNFTWVSSTMPKFRKTNDTIPRTCPDRPKDGQKDGWKDSQTLFYRTFPATIGGPTQHIIKTEETFLTEDRDKVSLQNEYLPEYNKNTTHSESQEKNSSMKSSLTCFITDETKETTINQDHTKSIVNIKHTDQPPLHKI